jgi:hypothetical protein
MVEKHFKSVAYAAELPAIATDVVEDCPFNLGM